MVDGVVETPNGAHFTTCTPDYERDERFQRAYAAAAADPEAWAEFRQRFLAGDEAAYQRAVRRGAPRELRRAARRRLRRRHRRGVSRRRRDPGQPDGARAEHRCPAGEADLRARPADLRRRGVPARRRARRPGPVTAAVIEGWIPYRQVFDVVASGRRHVMMGASQIDRSGNYQHLLHRSTGRKPKSQLLGVRGGPGNTVNHRTSYWVPKHSTRVFVPSRRHGLGRRLRPGRAAGAAASRFHGLPGRRDRPGCLRRRPARTAPLRLVSVHPGVTVEEVSEATGFELVDPAEVGATRAAHRGRACSLSPSSTPRPAYREVAA